MSPVITETTASGDWRVGMFAVPDIAARFLPDGDIRLASRLLPSPSARTTLDWLARWSAETPDAAFVTEYVGEDQGRQTLTYGEAWRESGRIGAGLLASGLVPGDRLLIIAPNSLAHMQVALGALRAGIIYVPIAVQYAAEGADPSKLAAVLEVIRPAGVYCGGAVLSPLLADIPNIFEGQASVAALMDKGGDWAAPDIAALDPEAPAKLLLTSGSTGMPKAVPYSHALMTHNTQATIDVWPFVTRNKPVLVDWLPWNHAFGGSNNVHLALSQGGTLHIDPSGGRPDKLGISIEALRTFRPTFHGAVPAGWAALLPTIEADVAFRQAFFSRLDVMFSAGAAMSADLFDRLSRASALVRGQPVPIVTGWGSTETGPGATMVHGLSVQPGCIGTPMPGVEIRLMRHGDKHELRVRGKSVMAGYWGRPDLSAAAFDEEGFFRTGDAGRLVDPERPELGLMFDGRLLDDFKLANGSWVNASALRMSLMQRAGGALRDVVIIGADKSYVAALCWVDQPEKLERLFAAHNRQNTGQTMRIMRFAALSTPPDAGAGELTPKGEINKKVLLSRRADAVAALYEEGTPQ
ncbi:AMP-binding protein [Sphingobium chungbukense]|uniref:AMP-binding protein n=1 Tax=Sphingobium chungbukense TaxID=56193 RepID=UPI000A0386A5|nr:AMP-binding protein [Sphingobium chungbukense]